MKHILTLVVAGVLSAQFAWSGENLALADLLPAGGNSEIISVPLPGVPSRTVRSAAGAAPDVLVRTMCDEVLKIVKTASKDEIMALLLPNFNFEHMTRLAAGKSWQQATEEQQKAVVAEFSKLLVRTYSSALDLLSDGISIEVKPLGPQTKPEEALVRTVAKSSGQTPVAIDYRMESAGETWQVFDVILDGVSLIVNYRSQFSGVIARSGIDGLIKLLAEKNSKP